jgi:hypothetical protein
MSRLHKKKIRGQKSGVWALPPKANPDSDPGQADPDSDSTTPPPPALERRAFVRHFCDIGALVDSWPARIENLSQGGLKVVIARRFEVGSILKVEVPVGGEEAYSMLLARVVRAIPEPTGGWGLGCAFLQAISEEELEALLPRNPK